MSFSPEIAAKRFGYGLSSSVAPPQTVAQMLDALRGADTMQQRFPIGTFRELQSQYVLYRRFYKHAREKPDTPKGKASNEKRKGLQRDARDGYARAYTQIEQRRVNAADGLRERLVAFWSDHFTAFGKNSLMRQAAPYYVEEAIRPHVNGRFADMLLSAVRHPIMLHYLDQEASFGPNSARSKRRKDRRGLNENLAREVMELHTLGVDGPYDQADVRALANLLTGMSRGQDFTFRFVRRIAEPGPQDVLGQAYDAKLSMARIEAVLTDLARHPATAAHIARKLAVHFVGDQPPDGVTADMTAAFLDSDGDLMQVYGAMLGHDDAWETPATNIRPPGEFVSAALRSLGVSTSALGGLEPKQISRLFFRPLEKMGQTWLRPSGPDGIAEEDVAWVTPQGLAGRMEWAMDVPKRLMDEVPEPERMMRDTFGAAVPQKVAFAVSAAENRAEAVGLILISPAFQRR